MIVIVDTYTNEVLSNIQFDDHGVPTDATWIPFDRVIWSKQSHHDDRLSPMYVPDAQPVSDIIKTLGEITHTDNIEFRCILQVRQGHYNSASMPERHVRLNRFIIADESTSSIPKYFTGWADDGSLAWTTSMYYGNCHVYNSAADALDELNMVKTATMKQLDVMDDMEHSVDDIDVYELVLV